MLPSDLLRARISRDRIRPIYVPIDRDNLALAEKLSETYLAGIGKRKGAVLDRVREIEEEGYDFKLVRGLSTLLERRATFEVEGEIDPVGARNKVFTAASLARVTGPADREDVLRSVSTGLGVTPEALEKALFSDLDDELMLRDFRPFPSAEALLRYYNLSLTQTLLFKSLRVEFSASGNWKKIFRGIKWLGLIYSVEKEKQTDGQGGGEGRGEGNGREDGRFRVSLDGPLSLFKMTERYGTSIAKLLPQITATGWWTIKAEILSRSRGGRVFIFETDSGELKGVLPGDAEGVDNDTSAGGRNIANGQQQRQHQIPSQYDSSTEEKFAKRFLAYGTGWKLTREPEPLVAGVHVLIPDFSFEKDGMKVYLEVVGYWTPEYLERKIAKLNLATTAGDGIDMMIAADESLACSKLERLKGKALVIQYKKDVPLKPILDHLKEREAEVIERQVSRLRGGPGRPALGEIDGEVVSIEEIAARRGVAPASVKMVMRDSVPEGYVKVGDSYLVSRKKLEELDGRLAGVEKLTEALEIIESSGVREDAGKILDILGYASTWEGMDMDRVKISKRTAAPTTATAREGDGEGGEKKAADQAPRTGSDR
jgi:uncharacterized protein